MDKTRHKALKQAYKLAFPAMGIYAIRNTANGRIYLDKTSNLGGALNRHRMELKLGTHRCPALLAEWRQFGEAQFSFEVVEQLKERSEPDFDYSTELEHCLARWRKEFSQTRLAGYNLP